MSTSAPMVAVSLTCHTQSDHSEVHTALIRQFGRVLTAGVGTPVSLQVPVDQLHLFWAIMNRLKASLGFDLVSDQPATTVPANISAEICAVIYPELTIALCVKFRALQEDHYASDAVALPLIQGARSWIQRQSLETRIVDCVHGFILMVRPEDREKVSSLLTEFAGSNGCTLKMDSITEI